MRDIVLITADSVRYDYTEHLEFLSSFDVDVGVTGSHYTRPSLASLLSSSYEAAITAEVVSPTLPAVLSDAGYTCLGFCPTPNADERFGFADGFDVYETYVDPGHRGSRLRQYLSESDVLRRLYYKLYPPQVKSEERPADREVIEDAIEQYNVADSPRFLWVHLMESHRPYGRGSDAVPTKLDQKAFFDPESLTTDERAQILDAYRGALGRVDDNVNRLLDGVDGDPIWTFTSDHGEGFGDAGFYFHRGSERCVDDFITRVPVVSNGIELTGPLSLLDLAPTIADAVDAEVPPTWHGKDVSEHARDSALTIAPWHDAATVAWQDFERKVIARDATVHFEHDDGDAGVSRADVPAGLESKLRDLGYMDAG